MVDEALAASSVAPADLETIGVTTGPGSFTGARLGVSFARGLALATEANAVGISVFQALADSYRETGEVLVVLNGGRGDIFGQTFCACEPTCEPFVLESVEGWRDWPIVGSAVTASLDVSAVSLDPVLVARRAATAGPSPALPTPLYLRAPDAKPQAIAPAA